jgi:hypothetical protein
MFVRLDLRCGQSSISHRRSVALLEEYVGPKR